MISKRVFETSVKLTQFVIPPDLHAFGDVYLAESGFTSLKAGKARGVDNKGFSGLSIS